MPPPGNLSMVSRLVSAAARRSSRRCRQFAEAHPLGSEGSGGVVSESAALAYVAPAAEGAPPPEMLRRCFVPSLGSAKSGAASKEAWRGVPEDGEARKADAALVFLHGLGDEGRHWDDVVHGVLAVAETTRKGPETVAVALPTTDQVVRWQDVTLAAWMLPTAFREEDGNAPTLPRKDDGLCLRRSVRQVHAIIRTVVDAHGVDASRVLIGGFSQGAAMALLAASTFPDGTLGGAFALSGYLPTNRLPAELRTTLKPPPHVLLCHGTHDDIIAVTAADRARELLERAGAHVESHRFEGLDHATSEDELNVIGRWIAGRWARLL